MGQFFVDSASTGKLDYSSATDFLTKWCGPWKPDWWLTLCAIPAKGGPPIGQSWQVRDLPQVRYEILQWVERNNTAEANVYFTYNPLHRQVNSKPAKSDLAAIVSIGLDLDPPDDQREYAARYAAVCDLAQELLEQKNIP